MLDFSTAWIAEKGIVCVALLDLPPIDKFIERRRRWHERYLAAELNYERVIEKDKRRSQLIQEPLGTTEIQEAIGSAYRRIRRSTVSASTISPPVPPSSATWWNWGTVTFCSRLPA